MTKSSRNWYSVSRSSRMSGQTRPIPCISTGGSVRTRTSTDPGGLGEVADDLALTARLVRRHVPGPSPGPGVGARHHQHPGHVVGERPGVRPVGAAEHRDALAPADPPDDPLAQRALRAGADEIGGADLGHPDPPGLVRGERVLPDAGADLSLAARRGQRRGLGHRMRLVVAADPQGPRRGAVAVQVRQRDQHRAAAFRGAEQAGGDRRPVGRPPVVRRVDAVVDHRGALGQAGHRPGVRGVRGQVVTPAGPEPWRLTTLTRCPCLRRASGRPGCRSRPRR